MKCLLHDLGYSSAKVGAIKSILTHYLYLLERVGLGAKNAEKSLAITSDLFALFSIVTANWSK